MAKFTDGTEKPKFRRYNTGHRPGQNGKGDWRRDQQVSEEEFASNWERTFGKKPKEEVDGNATVHGEVSPGWDSDGDAGDQTA